MRRNGRLCQLLYAVPEPLFHDRGACSAHLLHCTAKRTAPKQTLLVGRLRAVRRQVSLRQLTLASESDHLRCRISLQ